MKVTAIRCRINVSKLKHLDPIRLKSPEAWVLITVSKVQDHKRLSFDESRGLESSKEFLDQDRNQ